MVSKLKAISKTNAKNRLLNDSNITIDAKHSEMINHFKKLQNSIPELKLELKKMIGEYNDKDIFKKNDLQYILYRDNLRESINELKGKIKIIINNDEMNKYFLNVGTLLHNYYENIENSRNLNNNSENFEKNLLNYNEECIDVEGNIFHKKDKEFINFDESKDDEEYNSDFEEDIEDILGNDTEDLTVKDMVVNKNMINNKKSKNETDSSINSTTKKYKSVLNFFNTRETKDIDENSEIISLNDYVYTSTKISDFVKEESTFKKKNILEEYLQKINHNYIPKIRVDMNIFKCPSCQQEMVLYPSDGIQICESCGIQQNIIIESDKPSFKDPPMEVCYFSYKRINHYNEWLAQFQAKESTEIPEEVYEKILAEIKKERITNLEKLDTKKIRHYLKKNKLNKYYDHAAHILYQINGVQPPCMSKELEEKLRLMFKEIQGPFMEVCPKTRKNFLNYSYVLHKFVELLGLDEYKTYFPLLKDREKLHQTDMIWKKICEKIGWDFIKSI